MQKKLLLSYIVIIFLAISISLIAFWSQGYQFISKQSEHFYLSQAKMLGDIFSKEEFKSIEDYKEFAIAYGTKYDVRVTIINKDGTVYADSQTNENHENYSHRVEVQKALNGESNVVNRFSETMGRQYSYSAVPVENEGFQGVLRISLPLSELFAFNSGLASTVLYTVIICFVVAVVLAIIFARTISKPINEVAKAAVRISEGELDIKIYTREKDEIGKLAGAFNTMAYSLKDNIDSLTKRNAELEAMLTSMSAGIVAINDLNEIIFYNKEFYRFIDRGESDLKGVSIYNIIRNTSVIQAIDEVRNKLTRVVKEGTITRNSNILITVSGTPLVSETGKNYGVLIIIDDITKMKKLENMRRDFVSNVTHELKTPLTSIRGFIETLKTGAIKNEAMALRFLDIIDIEAERLFELIKDILILSEIESKVQKEVIPCNLNEVILQTIDLLQGKISPSVSIVFKEHPLKRDFYCNPDRMKQLFINLLDNAIMYTEKGYIEVELIEHTVELEIHIRDSGIGMEEEHLERIFERFYRVDRGRSRKVGGTGLGLSIVKHIVELYNGRIKVLSKPNEGTEFIIHFPYQPLNPKSN